MSSLAKFLLVPAVAALSWTPAASQPPEKGTPVAILNARIHTLGPAGTLERATVVLEGGRIAAVGANVRIPSGARVIRGSGLEVYPGMVNAWSNLGLTEISSISATVDTSEIGDFNPHLLAYSAIHPASEHFPVARVNGITSSLTVPSGGIISGQATLLRLDGWTVEEMALLKSAGMVLDFPVLGDGVGFRFRATAARRTGFSEQKRQYEKKVNELAQLLASARHYAQALEADPGTQRDRQLDALVPVVQGRMTVFLQADAERDIRNGVEFALREKLRLVLVGGREADKAAALLKQHDIPVILGSIVALPVRQDEPYDSRFTVPRDLAKAGVRFALTSPSSPDVRNLPYEAGFAAAYGLPRDEALRSITSVPAQILGVGDRIGSIEKGKLADLVVTDGDLLEMRTQVKHLFIGGKSVSLDSKHTQLYQKYINRP